MGSLKKAEIDPHHTTSSRTPPRLTSTQKKSLLQARNTTSSSEVWQCENHPGAHWLGEPSWRSGLLVRPPSHIFCAASFHRVAAVARQIQQAPTGRRPNISPTWGGVGGFCAFYTAEVWKKTGSRASIKQEAYTAGTRFILALCLSRYTNGCFVKRAPREACASEGSGTDVPSIYREQKVTGSAAMTRHLGTGISDLMC